MSTSWAIFFVAFLPLCLTLCSANCCVYPTKNSCFQTTKPSNYNSYHWIRMQMQIQSSGPVPVSFSVVLFWRRSLFCIFLKSSSFCSNGNLGRRLQHSGLGATKEQASGRLLGLDVRCIGSQLLRLQGFQLKLTRLNVLIDHLQITRRSKGMGVWVRHD